MGQSELFLIVNAVIYLVILFFLSQKTKHVFCGTTFIFGWYSFAAISSVLFYTHPLTIATEYHNPIFYQGLIYFGVLTLILLYPIYRFDNSEYVVENLISDRLLVKIIKILFFIQIVVFIFYLSDFFRLLYSDYGTVRDDAASGDVASISKKNYLIEWTLTFCIALRNISTIISFYSFVFLKRNRTLVTSFWIFSSIMPFFISVLFVLRSFMLFQILLFFFLLIIFREFFSKKFFINITIYGGVFLILVIYFITLISENRFGDVVSWAYYKYAGETMVNFSGQMWSDLKGCTDGTVYFQYFLKILGNDTINYSLSEKWSYMNAITGIDTHIFYGFIGGLVLEFDFYATVVICVILSYLLSKCIKTGYLRLSNLILLGGLANLLFTGSFLFIFQGLWGNLEIVLIVLSYIFFRKIELKKDYCYENRNPHIL